MISEAKTVANYLKEAPEKRKAVLTKLRKLCNKILTGYTESMASKAISFCLLRFIASLVY